MFAFASLNFRFSRMLAGLLLAGLLLVAAVATWFIASGPAPRATGPAPPTRAGAVSLQTPPLTGRFPVGTMSLRLTDRSRGDRRRRRACES